MAKCVTSFIDGPICFPSMLVLVRFHAQKSCETYFIALLRFSPKKAEVIAKEEINV
jgi:hypothetical protein